MATKKTTKPRKRGAKRKPRPLTAPTIKRYLKPTKILGRWTTFNGTLQSALAVPEAYDPARHAEALQLLGQNPDAVLECVFCGDVAATWDHLENIVRETRFSGFGHRIYNLVPACRTCNERKGSKDWEEFLDVLDPPDKPRRVELLREFARRNDAERFGWDRIVEEFPDLAGEYDRLRSEIRQRLKDADMVANKIRDAVADLTASAHDSEAAVSRPLVD